MSWLTLTPRSSTWRPVTSPITGGLPGSTVRRGIVPVAVTGVWSSGWGCAGPANMTGDATRASATAVIPTRAPVPGRAGSAGRYRNRQAAVTKTLAMPPTAAPYASPVAMLSSVLPIHQSSGPAPAEAGRCRSPTA